MVYMGTVCFNSLKGKSNIAGLFLNKHFVSVHYHLLLTVRDETRYCKHTLSINIAIDSSPPRSIKLIKLQRVYLQSQVVSFMLNWSVPH